MIVAPWLPCPDQTGAVIGGEVMKRHGIQPKPNVLLVPIQAAICRGALPHKLSMMESVNVAKL